jgi:hypothetical protein
MNRRGFIGAAAAVALAPAIPCPDWPFTQGAGWSFPAAVIYPIVGENSVTIDIWWWRGWMHKDAESGPAEICCTVNGEKRVHQGVCREDELWFPTIWGGLKINLKDWRFEL